jgi:CRP/FNR family transcriptional regulator, cyclic AMP receptor protein
MAQTRQGVTMSPFDQKPERIFLNKRQIKKVEQGKLADYLKPDQIELLFQHCKAWSFKSGSFIVRQGQAAEGVYIIIDGSVDMVARILGEGNTNIDYLESGGLIGGISFIELKRSPASAIAKTNVTCLFVSNVYFDFLNAIDPDAKYQITKAINTQLCKSMKRTHDQAVKYISKSDMVGLSFIGRALHSATQPVTLELKGEQDDNLVRLMQNPLMNIFSSEEKQELLMHSSFIRAPKNCILIHESEKQASCYIMLHGAVQSSILQDNKLAKLSVIGPGSLFAGIGCIDKKSTFTISFITCESAVLFKLSDEDLTYFKQKSPMIWYKLFSYISQSLVALAESVNKLDVRLHIESYNR